MGTQRGVSELLDQMAGWKGAKREGWSPDADLSAEGLKLLGVLELGHHRGEEVDQLCSKTN
jgi:hypothetical protein